MPEASGSGSGTIGDDTTTSADKMARYQARGQPLDVKKLFAALKGLRKQPRAARVSIPEGQVVSLCAKVKEILTCEQTVVNLDGPVIICGDIHGQFHDLCRLFDAGGWPPAKKYLFMGDYVDRGTHSLETIMLLFSLKVMWPDKIILLRGNHECSSINRVYGFYDDCKRRYSIKIWKVFGAAFDYLPLAAVVASRIFCVHGGLSPDVHDLPAIRSIERPLKDGAGTGPSADLLWSDPDHDITGWGENDRGVGFCFGSDVVRGFLQRNNLDLVCRAHQVVQDGYEFFAERKLVTVFSAPNYCNEFDNAAAMLSVSESLICSFIIVKPEEKERAMLATGGTGKKDAKGKKGKGASGRRQTQFIGGKKK